MLEDALLFLLVLLNLFLSSRKWLRTTRERSTESSGLYATSKRAYGSAVRAEEARRRIQSKVNLSRVTNKRS
jgi:hypothetical protein